MSPYHASLNKGIKFPAGQPEGPEREQDFALGVQPRMGGGTGVAEGSLIEVPEGTGAAFGGLEISAIADGFQGADPLAVELFITEGFVIAGAVANGQTAVADQPGEFREACWVLNIGDKEMSADEADAWNGAEPLDFGELAAGLTHQAAELGLTGEGLVQ